MQYPYDIQRVIKMLPVRPETSNFLRLVLPVVLVGGGRRRLKITIDMSCVSDYLDLSYKARIRLAEAFMVGPVIRIRKTRLPLDYQKLARKYQQLLDNGTCVNMAEVARNMGVSRAWVSKVMNRASR